ncbi:MAG: CDP-alcohol phosphatidyltransferase family protein [Chloroflexi bacterium]|nr:CDP-alcohol phosphatidyltransferase family protein [Chloroflexota bacterium]
MSASRPHVPNLREDSVLPSRVKEGGRAILAPVVRLAMALGLTPNSITVIGLGITVVAAVLVGTGWLLVGAALLTAGSLLDAVDGALARATGGATAFGSFLDSTLDRAGEAILYVGIAAWLVASQPEPLWPVLALLVALSGSFLVSYAHARAQGIGLAADVGLAPRTERLVIVIAGVALAGLGFVPGLLVALVALAVLTTATVIQRIWHVWRLSRTAALAKEEN